MAMIPMEYGGGTVKLTYGEFTTNAGGQVTFDSDRRIINAWSGNGASDAKVLMIVPRSTYDCAQYYIDSSTQTIKKLSASTTYTIQYTYVLNTD